MLPFYDLVLADGSTEQAVAEFTSEEAGFQPAL
jgi:hypothetical protein